MSNDFAPATRNQALWASDSRMVADGRAAEVYLQRTGQMDPPDLSDNEAVQWGHLLQLPIQNAIQHRLGVELKEADYMMTHPSHSWMRSHFDAISADGETLFEIKNYGAHTRKSYGDDGSQIIKPADFAQIVHESAVHGINKITLAVLFGGQELCLYPFYINEMQHDDLIKTMAELWGNIQTRNPPTPESVEAAKKLFPVSTAHATVANQAIERDAAILKSIKAQIKSLEEEEGRIQASVQAAMGTSDTLQSIDGKVLATWKSAKASMAFDASLFKQAMPDVYDSFVVERIGSRRFLLK